MVALTITATSVVAQPGATIIDGTAAATITAGQAVYLDTATGLYGLADTDGATTDIRAFAGFALNGAAVSQPIRIHQRGPLAIGATVTRGVGYYLSPTAGGVAPVADIITGAYPTFLGFATSATVINVQPVAAGVIV